MVTRNRTEQLLEVMLYEHPEMDVQIDGDEITLSFAKSEETITVDCPETHAVDRVNKAMACIAGKLIYCEHCPHKTSECRENFGRLKASMRHLLGQDGFDRFRSVAKS